jgi:CRP-like cAMP-binding protein
MTPAELFGRHHLLGNLAPADLNALLADARLRHVRAAETIFHRGDPGDGLYGVLKGRVVVTVESEDGKELILNSFGPGEFFGEIALLDGMGRTASAIAREPSSLLFIARRVFIPFLEARPKVAVRMIALLCERLRRTTHLIEDSTFLNVPARLAKQLLALAGVASGPVDLPISQDELARTLGVSREMVSRQLAVWKKAGLVELRRGHVVVCDPATFDRAIGGD